MPKFRCPREVITCGGDQEFQVEALNENEAREKFRKGEGELVQSNVDVVALGEYDLETIWQED